MQEHLKLLGMKVRDVVTGFSGIVTSVSFDISGCIQGLVASPVGKDGKDGERGWYDTKRLIPSGKPVTEQPDFVTIPGGQSLPGFSQKPSTR